MSYVQGFAPGGAVAIGMNDDVAVSYGTSNDASFLWETADASAHYLSLVIGTSRNLIISEDNNIDWGHAASTNPTLWIQSADETTTADYINLSHDQTDANIVVGAGSLLLNIAGAAIAPSADDGAALGIASTGGFSDVFLAAGASVNFDNGDVIVAHSANTLAVSGATLVDIAAGIFELNDAVRFDTGVAIVAGSYSVGRDADGTNQLHFNVPTGATFEFSVNDTVEATLSATAVDFQGNSITTTGGGSLTGTWSDLGSVTTVDINGGTIDGVTIGGASAGAISATTVTTSGDVTVGSATTTAGRLMVREDQNAGTVVRVENTTDGTAATCGVDVRASTGGTVVAGGLTAFSPSYTPAGGIEADCVELASSGAANGIILQTRDATPIKVKTNATHAASFLSGGELVVGRETLAVATHIAEFEKNETGLVRVRVANTTDDTTSSAGFTAVSSSGSTFQLAHSAELFTPVAGIVADEGYLWLQGGASMAFITATAVPIRVVPNGTEEVVFPSGGGIEVNNRDILFKSSLDSAAVADEVSIGGYEIGATNRVLAISQETAVAADADETKFSNKLQVRINGSTYFLMLTTT